MNAVNEDFPTTDAQQSEPVSVLHVPARMIPAPQSISPRARAALVPLDTEAMDFPRLDDAEGWRQVTAGLDAWLLPRLVERSEGFDAAVEIRVVGGSNVYVITPAHLPLESERRVYLYVHGGGLTMGGGDCCRAMGLWNCRRSGVRTWAVDYRMPPDHPYPTPLEDCVAAYRELLSHYQPDEIIVGGGSAGGNLAAALILKARDEGLPLPAAVVLLSPEVDLTESGDTFQTDLGVMRSLGPQIDLYAGGHALDDPYLSPLFGDFTKGFPPTFLQAGTRDLFLSNTVRMHRSLRSAGVSAELHVFEAMPHGGFWGAPEDVELEAEVRRFIDAHWQHQERDFQ